MVIQGRDGSQSRTQDEREGLNLGAKASAINSFNVSRLERDRFDFAEFKLALERKQLEGTEEGLEMPFVESKRPEVIIRKRKVAVPKIPQIQL